MHIDNQRNPEKDRIQSNITLTTEYTKSISYWNN